MDEYVGFDVSKEKTAFCVKDVAGEILSQAKALARKLAVIMHRMLITGEAFRWPETEEAA